MSYEPTLVTNRDHLEKYIEGLNFDFLRSMDKADLSESDQARKWLIEQLDQERKANQNIQIGKARIIILQPIFSSFNRAVREVLDDADIEYGIDN